MNRVPWRAMLMGTAIVGALTSGLHWGCGEGAFVREILPQAICASVGMFTGMIELIQRYSQGTRLKTIMVNQWAGMYMAVNALASLLVYGALQSNVIPGVTINIPAGASQLWVALVAGLGGMVVLRSAVVTIRADEKEHPVGLGIVLDVLSQQLDHRLDQARGVLSADEVEKIMQNVDPKSAGKTLTLLVLSMLERTSQETQEALREDVEELLAENISDKAKALVLGINIQRVAGSKILKKAVDMLGSDIKYTPSQSVPPNNSGGNVGRTWNEIDRQLEDFLAKLLIATGPKKEDGK